ncbi:hypothetical protein IJ076_03690 [Candidatus Saccharibacteria bacterium]|nr:hypothetical protein [Candidatus Saccharibacteria bacterium]
MNNIVEETKKFALNLSGYEEWQMWLVGGAGLALMFLGYKIKKIAFFVVWFLLGYILTGYLMPIINGAVAEIASSDLWQNLLPIGGGLLVGLMGFSIEKLCVGGACMGLCLMITAQYFGTDIQTMVIGGIIGAVLAGFAVMMMKPASIIATSVAGGYALTLAILTLNGDLNGEELYWPLILAFSAVGALVQFLTTRHDM